MFGYSLSATDYLVNFELIVSGFCFIVAIDKRIKILLLLAIEYP